LKNIKPPRPLTHNLARSLIEKLHGKVDKAVLKAIINSIGKARENSIVKKDMKK